MTRFHSKIMSSSKLILSSWYKKNFFFSSILIMRIHCDSAPLSYYKRSSLRKIYKSSKTTLILTFLLCNLRCHWQFGIGVTGCCCRSPFKAINSRRPIQLSLSSSGPPVPPVCLTVYNHTTPLIVTILPLLRWWVAIVEENKISSYSRWRERQRSWHSVAGNADTANELPGLDIKEPLFGDDKMRCGGRYDNINSRCSYFNNGSSLVQPVSQTGRSV